MAVILRLTRMGKKGERKFRLIAKEKRSRRDGNAIEELGWYEKSEKGQKKQINTKRVEYWLSVGAKPTPTVAKLLNL